MLPSIRPLLRFIDLEDDFDKHGFQKKVTKSSQIEYSEYISNKCVSSEQPSNSPRSVKDVSS